MGKRQRVDVEVTLPNQSTSLPCVAYFPSASTRGGPAGSAAVEGTQIEVYAKQSRVASSSAPAAHLVVARKVRRGIFRFNPARAAARDATPLGSALCSVRSAACWRASCSQAFCMPDSQHHSHQLKMYAMPLVTGGARVRALRSWPTPAAESSAAGCGAHAFPLPAFLTPPGTLARFSLTEHPGLRWHDTW